VTQQSIQDDEFGEIDVRRIKTARAIKVGVTPAGKLRATMPPRAPLYLLKRLVKDSRSEVRALLERHVPKNHYESGMQIGKSHSLLIMNGPSLNIAVQKTVITLALPDDIELSHPEVQQLIRQQVIKSLRKEAKSYLPRRLKTLANTHGYQYERVRFSHASTRWGSCSTSGTISLNIALMRLPFELIDYVLIHELCHTQQMNHSPSFWRLVEAADPSYLEHRKRMKLETPTI
jgi:predicted metal-dependent hydrolase